MRVHFSAAIPCALRLGGAPAGMCGEAEKFADLPEDEEVLVEFLPADGDYFPLGFLWNARRAAAPRGVYFVQRLRRAGLTPPRPTGAACRSPRAWRRRQRCAACSWTSANR